MLDLRMIRRDPERVRRALARRGDDVPIDQLLEKDEQWRSALAEVEKLKALRNKVSDEIGRLKREKQDASEAIAEMKRVAETIRELDTKVKTLEQEIEELLLVIPNIPPRVGA